MADDLVVGYRALGASTLAKESYEVEVLRWTAIAELVNTSIAPERQESWGAALTGLKAIANAFDRDADSTDELAQSANDLATAAALHPFTQVSEAATWASIIRVGIGEVTGDVQRVFSARSSSVEGIRALELGVQVESVLDPTAPSRLEPLLESERSLLADDLRQAGALLDQSRDAQAQFRSPWNPVRFALLHRSLDRAEEAQSVYHRHGDVEGEATAQAAAVSIRAALVASYPRWVAVVLLTVGTALAAGVAIQLRLMAWNSGYAHARRANFLLGVPR